MTTPTQPATERARELLAAEYDRAGKHQYAALIRVLDKRPHYAEPEDWIALRAIDTALRRTRIDDVDAHLAALSAPQAEMADREGLIEDRPPPVGDGFQWPSEREWAEKTEADREAMLCEWFEHLAALRSSASSPVAAGMVLVPVEPTEAIEDAMHEAIKIKNGEPDLSLAAIRDAYHAALAAASN